MKAAVIGSGGREHTLAWRLSQSPSVDQVYACPGSAAMAACAEVTGINWEDTDQLIDFLKQKQVDVVVIGPEAPLVAGLTDRLERAGLAVFGPSQAAAELEGSKVFAKEIMKKYHIPTAAYDVFTDADEAKAFIRKVGAPIVVKADGLAAGKGVIVAGTVEEAEAAVEDMLRHDHFGAAGHTVVVEEFMSGEEASLLAFVDGKTVVPMIAAQDHKRIFDGDKGPNTGGMGAYAPAPVLTPALQEQAVKTVLEPLVAAMAAEGKPYKGCLYAGLMITDEGPRVVEFNARFGDPETQVVLPLLEGDLGKIVLACAEGKLSPAMVSWRQESAACVVMASAGYPESSHKDDLITGDLSLTEDTWVFHSGTVCREGQFYTAGGRVLGVTARAEDLQGALDKCYTRVKSICFEGAQFRRDIGQKAFKKR